MFTLKRVVGTALVVAAFISGAAQACTVFCASDNNSVLMGNNEDWKDPYTRIWFLPPEEGKHGRIYLGFERFGIQHPQGGVNDHGLAFDITAAPSRTVKSPHKKPFPTNLVVKIMEECSTVVEAVAMFDRYSMGDAWAGQYYFADATGDAAIIEIDTTHRKKGGHLVVTNFYLSQVQNGVYPCNRYRKADAMLARSRGLSVDLFRKILDAVHLEGATPTQYSYIFDFKSGTLYLYYFHDFSSVVTLDVKVELAKGRRSQDIADMFPEADFASVRQSSEKEPVTRRLRKVLLEQGVAEAIDTYHSLKEHEQSRCEFGEQLLNLWAVELTGEGKTRDAIEVFKLAVAEYPDSNNVYARLGWGYEQAGQTDLASQNYQKCLERKPDKQRAIEGLKRLRGREQSDGTKP